MGHIYANKESKPTAAVAILGDFSFFAGSPDMELVSCHEQPMRILVPQNQAWADMIEAVYGTRAVKVSRYAIKKEPNVFDLKYLQGLMETVPQGYSLRMIDKDLFEKCRRQSWSRDFVAQYKSSEEYERIGLGAVLVKNGEIVSGASSYSSYQNGIEIEIDTREDHRRKGLALICGAKLILECLDRGLYPSWDAQNLASVALAEKLGYHFDHEYTAYEIRET